jgi:hypothetical protein
MPKPVAKITLKVVLYEDDTTSADLDVGCIGRRDDVRQYEKRLASALMQHARNACKPEMEAKP